MSDVFFVLGFDTERPYGEFAERNSIEVGSYALVWEKIAFNLNEIHPAHPGTGIP